MNDIISLIIGWVVIAGFLLWLDFVNRKQKELNNIHKDRNKATKYKRM